MNKNVIGICGAIEAGKDHTTEVLLDHIQKDYPSFEVCHIKHAHGIYDVVAAYLGIYKEDLSHRNIFDRKFKDSVQLVIEGVEYTGRDLLKMVDPTTHNLPQALWANKVKLIIDNNYVPKSPETEEVYFLISDLRKEPEYNILRKYKGFVLYVENTEAEKQVVEKGLHTHASEMFVPTLKNKADLVLYNEKTTEYDKILTDVFDSIILNHFKNGKL